MTNGMRIAFGTGLACALAAPLGAQVTERVNVSSGGIEANQYTAEAEMSADGRFVTFTSSASNLVSADTNDREDVFVRDLQLGTTRRLSLAWDGGQANDFCTSPGISGDAAFVGFTSRASNLVPGDANGDFDVFVRARIAGTIEIVSVTPAGTTGNGSSAGASFSGEGRFVVFQSTVPDLVPGDGNLQEDVFLRDRLAGTTERVSVSTGGTEGNGQSFSGVISEDGRFVAFVSAATNLVAGDANFRDDVFVRDLAAGTTALASSVPGGAGDGVSDGPSFSADGRYLAFTSWSTDLVPGDTNGWPDVFVLDRTSGTLDLASVGNSEGLGNYGAGRGVISGDGRFVAFESGARNLIAGDTNDVVDVFVRDLQLGTTERAGVAAGGAEPAGTCNRPAISSDGRWVSFLSASPNLVEGDSNSTNDVFVHDRESTGFTSLCDPGVGVTVACPCGNPPGGPTRGCDNSSATGGAALAASGSTSLASDTLVFATSGEKPTALSIVLQGNGWIVGGTAYGQGIRCAGGSLKRLYAKSAVGGSIVAPDVGAGDPSVSARSAATGDPIQPGQPRWYVVYYRDPIVLGGCPSASTFNATQTGQVLWTP